MARRQTRRRQTRRRKHQRGGWADAPTNGTAKPATNGATTTTPTPTPTTAPTPLKGGRRRSTRKASKWNMFVKKVYHDMKRKDKNATFGDALKEASRRKKDM